MSCNLVLEKIEPTVEEVGNRFFQLEPEQLATAPPQDKCKLEEVRLLLVFCTV